jgi:hypothetical protein
MKNKSLLGSNTFLGISLAAFAFLLVIAMGVVPNVSWDSIFQASVTTLTALLASFFIGWQIKTSSEIATSDASQDLRLTVYKEIVSDFDSCIDATFENIKTAKLISYYCKSIETNTPEILSIHVEKCARRSKEIEVQNQVLLDLYSKASRTLSAWDGIAFNLSNEGNTLLADRELVIEAARRLEISLASFLVIDFDSKKIELRNPVDLPLCQTECARYVKCLRLVAENIVSSKTAVKSKFKGGSINWFSYGGN